MKAKKLLWTAALTAFLIALCAVAVHGASYTAPEGTYTYELIAGGTQAEITDAEVSGAITIPTTLGGKPVTSIGEEAFYYNEITSVVIPSGVTSIGSDAFGECYSLESVTLPATLKTIGEYAFYWCRSLRSVVLPEGLKTIGDEAFYNCEVLDNIVIPASVTSIGEDVFLRCASLENFSVHKDNAKYASQDGALFNKAKTTLIQFLASNKTSYTVPATVKTIVGYAFADNASLKKITLSSGMTSVGGWALAYCYALETVVMPNSIKSLGEDAFTYCESLKSVTFSNQLTTIGVGAFSGCESLRTVKLPESLTTIGAEAFSGSGLTKITIPAKVSSIRDDAFFYCLDLTSISVSADNKKYASQSGVLFNKAKTTLLQYPMGNTSGDYTTPATVKTIGEYAFYYCKNIRGITLSAGVTTIGESAFESSNITKVTLPASLKTIDDYAFSECTHLGTVTIPNGVTRIGEAAFYGTMLMTSVNVPASVTTLGEGAFAEGFALASINVAADNKKYASQDGVLFNKDKTTLLQYPAGNTRLFYVVPSTVKTIAAYAFLGNFLYMVNVPKTVTKLGEYALGTNYYYDDGDTKVACYKDSAAHKYALAQEMPVLLLDSHTHTAGAWKTTVKATATAQGKQTQSCTTCGRVLATKAILANHTVKLNLTKITLGKTESYTLKATTSVKTTVKWKSSDAKVATVDSNGKIKAVGIGSATITVTTAGGRTATCVVTVKAAPASVKLSKSTLTLAKGKTETLTATLNPGGAASYAKSWTSSDTKVAKVDANGKITAIGKGTAPLPTRSLMGKKRPVR